MEKEVEQKTSKLTITSFVLGLVVLIGSIPVYLSDFAFDLSTPLANEAMSHYARSSPLAFLVTLIFFFSPLMFILTVILAIMAFKKINRNSELKGKYLAVLGVILSFFPAGINFILLWGRDTLSILGLSWILEILKL